MYKDERLELAAFLGRYTDSYCDKVAKLTEVIMGRLYTLRVLREAQCNGEAWPTTEDLCLRIESEIASHVETGALIQVTFQDDPRGPIATFAQIEDNVIIKVG